jgi:HEAT repeat
VKRNGKLLLVLLAGIAAMAGGVALLTTDQKTHYQGRSLSEWLDIAGRDDGASEQAKAAIRAIGTNAVPTLLTWIRHEDPNWRWRRRVVLRAVPKSAWDTRLVMLLSGITAGDNVYRAVNAFDILGTNAVSAIPALVSLSKDTNRPHAAFYAINALSLLGPPACPHMVAALRDTSRPYRDVFARDFPNLASFVGTNVCRHALAAALLDPDPSVREASAGALAEIGCQTNAPLIK